ncbi:MAG: LacI family DNA-binding transcriptional regulator [Caldilineaceae bacterium]
MRTDLGGMGHVETKKFAASSFCGECAAYIVWQIQRVTSRRGQLLMRSTIQDVARKAGVSTATVSHAALRGLPERVSPSTRHQVLQVAEELDYRIAPEIRARRGRHTAVIAVPLADQWFYSKLVSVAEIELMTLAVTSCATAWTVSRARFRWFDI